MKKLISILLLLLLLLPVCTAAASGTTYDIPELKMTIDAPDGWFAYTRDIDQDDPNLDVLGYDASSLKQMYIDNEIYFNAIPPDFMSEIVITMIADEDTKAVYDYNDASADDLDELSLALKEAFVDMGATVEEPTIYKHNQALFVVIDFVHATVGTETHSREYHTAINGQVINITMHSYTGPLTDDAKQTLLNTIESVTFTEVTARPGIDFTEVLYMGIGGAVIGAIVGLVLYLIRKKKKPKATAATVFEKMTEDKE